MKTANIKPLLTQTARTHRNVDSKYKEAKYSHENGLYRFEFEEKFEALIYLVCIKKYRCRTLRHTPQQKKIKKLHNNFKQILRL
jgi:hypothetical protein